MEVDTGATVSIITEHTLKAITPDATLKSSRVVLKTYTGEQMPVLGELQVKVQYGQQSQSLPLVVVASNGPSLFGRNWLESLRLNWQQIRAVSAASASAGSIDSLLETHAEIFKDELGTIKSFSASLQVRSEARPKFFKARSVPFAIKGALDRELDRLESCGILKKVTSSDWVAPIVAFSKKDGNFRICRDYKVTVNQALDVDQYPLPRPDELFATLAGGKKFSKLDLSQAYQQLVLDDESVKYVTINTHRGLYQYTRLPFGVASAPAIFQKVMDTMLQGIPHVICYLDDILVTGENDNQHLHNLAEVLKRLQLHGVRMKKAKCQFMQASVEYLGHRIDADGLHTTDSKLKAITQAPTPQNVQELKSFLGLLNYYGKFILNLATILHPLNTLLQKGRRWQWTTECTKAFASAKAS